MIGSIPQENIHTTDYFELRLLDSARHVPGRKFREKGDSYRKEVAYRNCDGLERLRDEVCDERKME